MTLKMFLLALACVAAIAIYSAAKAEQPPERLSYFQTILET